MKSIKIPTILIIILVNFLPLLVFAQGDEDAPLPLVPCGGSWQNPCTISCFFSMIDRIIRFLLYWISIPLAITAFMVAGIHLIFGSSEQAVSRGKTIFKFTFIGLFIAFAAWLIIDLILGNLLAAGYAPWNEFPGSC